MLVRATFMTCGSGMGRRLFAVRFWSKVLSTPVENDDCCWVWTGATNSDGYGVIRCDGQLVYAHRVSYVMHGGELLDGEVVRHTCDNPPCVRPTHLVKGTVGQNIRDQWRRGRRAQSLRGLGGRWKSRSGEVQCE